MKFKLLLIAAVLFLQSAQANVNAKIKQSSADSVNESVSQRKNDLSKIGWKLDENQKKSDKYFSSSIDLSAYANKQGSTIIKIGPQAACDGTYLGMKALIEAAPDGSEIHLASGTYSGDFANFTIIDKSITVIGGYSQDCQTFNPLAKTTLNLTNASQEVVKVIPESAEMTVELINLVLEGGRGNHGGINIQEGLSESGKAKVYLVNSIVRNNQGTQSGGINIDGGSLFVESTSSIQSNKSDANGGGINCLNSEVFITNSIVGLNNADENDSDIGNGGGVYLDNCDLLISSNNSEESGIAFNTAINGGGIFATNSSDVYVVGQNTSVAFNTASFDPLVGGYGGGVTIENNSQLFLYSAKIDSNQSFLGGGVYIGSNSSLLTGRNFATLEECNIAQCTRIINNQAISDNTNIAYSVAGGIYAESTADITVNQAWIIGNQADFASAIQFNANQSSVKHSMILNNTTNAKPFGNIGSTVLINSGSQVDFLFNTLAGNIHGDVNAPVLSVSGVVLNANISANIIQENTFVTAALSIDSDNTDSVIQCQYNLLESNTAVDECDNATNLDLGNEAAFVDANNDNFHISSQSLAIDHAAAVPIAIDERDIDNELIIIADAGADEAPVNRVGINSSACIYPTINEALLNAESGDILYLKPGIYNETLTISKDISLYGASQDCTINIQNNTSDTVIIDGTGITNTTPLITIASENSVDIRNLTVQQSQSGGLYWNSSNGSDGTTILTNVTVINNQAQSAGAGLYLSPDVTVNLNQESTVSNNLVTDNNGQGGGVYVASGALLNLRNNSKIGTINQPNIADNGGGIYLSGGTVALYDSSEVSANAAINNGGGIFAAQGSNIYLFEESHIGNSQIGNTADLAGGGVFITGEISTFNMYANSYVINNSATDGSGGGLYSIDESLISVNAGSFENNSALTQGGAIYSLSEVIISKALFNNNSAEVLGSAIYVASENSSVELDNSLIINNTQSPAFHASAGVSASIINATFADNRGSININSDASSFNLSNSIIWGDFLPSSYSGTLSGGCNIDEFGVLSDNTQDPLFETGSGIDYLLSVNSPAIDKCTSSNNLDFFDTVHSFDGNYHPSSNEGDMGAIEYIPSSAEILTVIKVGNGNGTVISEFGDINCGSSCDDEYPSGLEVTLQATSEIDSQFMGWSGGGCSGTSDCIVTLDQSFSVTAEFSTDTDLIFTHDFD
ncbi:MAG: hypothetical protein AB8B80_16170 [Marinicellaceae bacterium]